MKKMAKRCEPTFEQTLDHIKGMIDESIAKLKYLRDNINTGGPCLDDEDKDLLKMAVMPFIKAVKKESVMFLMCGSVDDYNASMETIERYARMIL